MPNFKFETTITFGNVLSAVSTLLVILAAVINLKLDVQAANTSVASLRAEAGAQIAAIQKQVEPVDDLKTRMVVVERNQVSGKADREKAQDQIASAVEDLRKQNLQILTTLSALVARLDATDKAEGKR